MSQEPVNKANKKVKIKMSLEEFKEETYKLLRAQIKDEEYISKLDADIERFYEESVIASTILGSNQISPDGYVFGTILLYPDLPY